MSLRSQFNEAIYIGSTLRQWADSEGLRPRSPIIVVDKMQLFDCSVKHPVVCKVTRSLFKNEHYAMAVQQACIALNCAVKNKSGSTKDGADLMFEVLPSKGPKLRFNNCRSESECNEQDGYMHVLAGIMRGIRNPRAHETPVIDEYDTALRIIGFVDHLMRKVDCSVKCRRKQAR